MPWILNLKLKIFISYRKTHNKLCRVVFPACLIIINDITAYFWGVALGHKFIKANLTTLSPNKTWEGFIGALFTTVILSIPVCYLYFFFCFSLFLLIECKVMLLVYAIWKIYLSTLGKFLNFVIFWNWNCFWFIWF